MALIISGRLFHRFNGQVIYRNGEDNLGGTPGGGSGPGGGGIDLGGDGYGGGTPYQETGTTGTKTPSGTPATSAPGSDASGNPTTVYTPGTYTPAAGVPVKNYPSANWFPPQPAPFWRINVTAAQQAGLEPGLSYIVMYDHEGNSLIHLNAGGIGWPDNGTPLSSPGNTDAQWAFYGSPSATFPGWKSLQADIGYIGYQFNTPVAVSRICYQAYINERTRSPRNFTIEYSQDGETWVVANTVVDELEASNHRFRPIVTDASTCPHQNVQGAPIAYPMPSGLNAAYALRVVVPGYTGPLISVETDLYGTVNVYPDAGGNLDVAFLQAVMNASGSIGVSKWWDQSGNGRTAIVVDVAACPLIIEGGLATTSVNGRPGLHMYPNAPFDLPFGPLQNGGSTVQAIVMNLDSTNWPVIVANQLTSGQTASIGYHASTRVLSLFRNGQADVPSGLPMTLGTTQLVSLTWFQNGDNSVTGGFSVNGTQANPISLDYDAKANSRGRIGQSFQVPADLGGNSMTNGYISEMLFYPAAGADTTGSLQAMSNYFGIPLGGGTVGGGGDGGGGNPGGNPGGAPMAG